MNSLSIGGTNASALGEGPGDASGQSITLNGGMLTYTGGGINANPTANALAWNPIITLLGSGGTINNSGSSFIGFSGGLTGPGNLTIYDSSGTQQVMFNTATANASSGFSGTITIGPGGHVQQRTSAANPLGSRRTLSLSMSAGSSRPTKAARPHRRCQTTLS